MSFEQGHTGKDDPAAARDDTPPDPPAFSLEKPAPAPVSDATSDAAPVPDAVPDTEPGPEPAAANPWAPPVPAPAPAPGVPSPGAPVPAPAAANPWAPVEARSPWGQGVPVGQPVGYPAYPPPPRDPSLYSNGVAIAALVVSFLCFFGIIGIVLGIVALVQIKRTGQRGRGMAIAAISVGTVWLLLLGLTIAGGAYDAADRPSARRSGSDFLAANSPFRLRTGDCATLVGHIATKKPDCSAPHNVEVYWVAVVSREGNGYPGAKPLQKQAAVACAQHIDQYLPDSWALPDDVDPTYAIPDREEWDEAGNRWIICLLQTTKPRTGSLHQELTSDQKQFLDVTNAFEDVRYENAEEDFETASDLAGFRRWATELSTAADREAGRLEAATWAAADRGTVARLAGEMRVAAQHYRAAAAGGDLAAVHREFRTAEEHLGADLVAELRRQLGLATEDQRGAGTPSQQVV
ncbi:MULTISPECIES: DUF4190 domain-containing protein [Kitasatospora]|uniref:DUF4190 domain-containing protein n=1 Tax=Kitasatospora setae (strain ATCC 33774 / DSM 43861 / JCM 3304 / KCC A-0304 / NBRC 14216 / KM-6054) TaxID=452652 RepID=E4N082_KITSK|nr:MULTISPECIES: DUF4190 domain-containing protein [Kitasatospora]BAJ31410.1 hypothetical protein KSE_56370 [Kitasatospora setae KM-6054]